MYKITLKKIFGAALCTTLCAVSFAGCGKKTVDYVNSDATQSGDATATAVDESDVANGNEEHWKEDIKSYDYKGDELTIKLDVTPVSEYMDNPSVTTYTEYEYTEENKEKAVKALFGNNQVYNYDLEYVPYFVVESEIDYIKECLEKIDEDNCDEADVQQVKKSLDTYEKLLINAPNDFVPIENYSGTRFFGYIDDKPFVLSFFDEASEEWKLELGEEPMPYGKEISFGYCRDEYFYEEGEINYNVKASSYEKKLAFLKEKMAEAGFGGNYYMQNMTDNDYNPIVDKDEITEFAVYSGTQFGSYQVYATGIFNSIYLQCSADKIIRLDISEPQTVSAVTDNVKLMTFDEIKEVIKHVFETEYDKLKLHATNNYGNIYDLSYLNLVYYSFYDEKEDVNLMIPVWDVMNEFYVNAMDGSVIYSE